MESHYFKKSMFLKSCVSLKDVPQNKLNEIIFVGKSNVGKSSLINSLTNNKKLAFTSSNPGHTKLLNYYLIDDKFYFVDSPGYGYSQKKDNDYTFYGNMLEEYFLNNKNIKLIIFLLDSRRVPNNDDVDFYNFLNEYSLPFIICMTKCDKLNQSMKSKIYSNLSTNFENLNKENIILTSIKNNDSILQLKTLIEKIIIN